MIYKKFSLLGKAYSLIPLEKKPKIIYLAIFILIGFFLEMAGIGMLLPISNFLLNFEVQSKSHFLANTLNKLGNPSKGKMVMIGMSLFVFFYLLKTIYLSWLVLYQYNFTTSLASKISTNLFEGYMRQNYNFHLEKNSSLLITNIQTEVSIFNSVLLSFITVNSEFILIFGVSIMLFIIEPFGTFLIICFLFISIYFFQRKFKGNLINWGKTRQTYDKTMSLSLMQGFGGIKDIKLLNVEYYFQLKYSNSSIKKYEILAKQNTLQQLPRYYLEFLAVASLSSLIFILTIQDKLSTLLPTLTLFAISAFRMIPSVNRIVGAMQQFKYAEPVVDLLSNEFKLINTNKSNINNNTFLFNNNISLNNVTFFYNKSIHTTICNINLEIKKGQTVGFIGSSGCGKSTLIDIIIGLLSPSQGSINVDGVNINSNLIGWQKNIGYVSQSIFLLDDSLRRNIAFGIDDENIDTMNLNKCIEEAQLETFINSLEEGLNTIVGERGVRLSGGQRQRIAIARALYRNPDILVLDEATSALDNETESEVMQAINALHGDKTILIVAHRLSTLDNCDRIFQFNEKNGLIEIPKN